MHIHHALFAAILPAAATLAIAVAAPATNSSPPPVAPITYFQTHCARCHGAYGQGYGDAFGKNLSPQSLRDKVVTMAVGPGQSPIDGPDLDAQVAYHRAVIDRRPFVSLSTIDGQKISGDVSPDAQLTASAGAKPLPAPTVTDHQWSLTLPPEIDGHTVTLTATRAGKSTVLDLRSATWAPTE